MIALYAFIYLLWPQSLVRTISSLLQYSFPIFQANMLEGGGKTPILNPVELEEIGFKIVSYPLSLIGVSIRAMEVCSFIVLRVYNVSNFFYCAASGDLSFCCAYFVHVFGINFWWCLSSFPVMVSFVCFNDVFCNIALIKTQIYLYLNMIIIDLHFSHLAWMQEVGCKESWIVNTSCLSLLHEKVSLFMVHNFSERSSTLGIYFEWQGTKIFTSSTPGIYFWQI